MARKKTTKDYEKGRINEKKKKMRKDKQEKSLQVENRNGKQKRKKKRKRKSRNKGKLIRKWKDERMIKEEEKKKE